MTLNRSPVSPHSVKQNFEATFDTGLTKAEQCFHFVNQRGTLPLYWRYTSPNADSRPLSSNGTRMKYTVASNTPKPISTPILPKKSVQPSHSASSATYMGFRVNRYGPLVNRTEEVTPSLARLGACAMPRSKSHRRRMVAAPTGISPSQFQNPGPSSVHPQRCIRVEMNHGTPPWARGITTRQIINARTITTQRGTVIPSGALPAETGEVLTRMHASVASIFARLIEANTICRIDCERSGRPKSTRAARSGPGLLVTANAIRNAAAAFPFPGTRSVDAAGRDLT